MPAQGFDKQYGSTRAMLGIRNLPTTGCRFWLQSLVVGWDGLNLAHWYCFVWFGRSRQIDLLSERAIEGGLLCIAGSVQNAILSNTSASGWAFCGARGERLAR
jgi:hypothetical protein